MEALEAVATPERPVEAAGQAAANPAAAVFASPAEGAAARLRLQKGPERKRADPPRPLPWRAPRNQGIPISRVERRVRIAGISS
jgi:hypothetical protein